MTIWTRKKLSKTIARKIHDKKGAESSTVHYLIPSKNQCQQTYLKFF